MTHKAPYPPFELPQRHLEVAAVEKASAATAVGVFVFEGEEFPPVIGEERAAQLGFTPKPGAALGETHASPTDAPTGAVFTAPQARADM